MENLTATAQHSGQENSTIVKSKAKIRDSSSLTVSSQLSSLNLTSFPADNDEAAYVDKTLLVRSTGAPIVEASDLAEATEEQLSSTASLSGKFLSQNIK